MSNPEEKQLTITSNGVRWLYEKYSAPLLGYISGVVSDQEEGEAYLITILSRFAQQHHQYLKSGEVSWLKLLQYSRGLLPELKLQSKNVSAIGSTIDAERKFEGLSAQQQEIFCAIYYHNQTIANLVERLGKSESVIRSEFKLAFDKVRRAGGN